MPQKRMKVYTIYGVTCRGPLTAQSVAYSQTTHRWTVEAYASSIRQAYLLAGREVMATTAATAGVRRIERDWWHDGSEPGPGDRTLAPYLSART